MNFNGKNVIVTGAAHGIGFAAAKIFAAGGANVLLVDLNAEGLASACGELKDYPGRALTFTCDVSDEARVAEAARYAISELGRIDILVNNAGIFRNDRGLFENSDSAAWKKKIDINILGTMYFTRNVIGNMLENGSGRIINVASVAAVYGIAEMADYSMTKGAIVGFTRALAKEVTERGVLVNCVSPGGISDDPKVCAQLSFMNRSGSYDECARLICFLAGEDAAYISGQNYVIDGCRKKM